jgi:tRNA pseudouridine13 synthase
MADRHAKRFFVSAYQAALFNQVLARRLARLDRLLPGDIAIKHSNGACFAVTDPAAEQARCRSWEISPTGPMLGPRMAMPTDTAGDIEKEILAPAQPALEQDPRIARDLGRGGRRALRCLAREDLLTVGRDEQGDYLQLAFVLDPGCYATTLLAEVMKADLPENHAAARNAPPGNPTTS